MDAERTGLFIAELRREKGLTQRQLAERLHVSFKAVSRWETGRGMPDIENLEALASELGVGVTELLSGERIIESIPTQEANAMAVDVISLFRNLGQRQAIVNVALGFLAGLVVVTLITIHLSSPSTLPYHEGIASVETSQDGTLVLLVEDGVTGCDVNLVEDQDTGYVTAFVTCYSKLLSQLFGTDDLGWHAPGTPHAITVGSEGSVDRVYYYPGAPNWPRDVLLYTSDESIDYDVVTQHELAHNHWVLVAAEAGVVGLIAYLHLRKRWFARRILVVSLFPICLAISMVAVLWNRGDCIYNASFYLSSILLLAIALYGLLVLLILRWRKTTTTTVGRGIGMPRWRRALAMTACGVVALLLIPGIIRTRTYISHDATVIVIPTYERIAQDGYPVNELGLTYGPSDVADYYNQPDLALVEGNDGVVGYVYTSELWGPEPTSIEEALASQREGPYTVLVYESDGVTVIGTFTANT